jgi:hypothetical protein
MRQRLANATIVVSVCLCLSNTMWAQVKDNLEVNFFGGGSWYSSKNFQISFPQSVTPVDGKFRLDHAWRAGVRVGVYTRGHWSEEFFYSYEPNKVHLIRRSVPASQTSLGIQVHNYGITGLYYLSDDESQPIRPFFSIGAGGTLYRLTPETVAFVQDPLRGNIPNMHNAHEFAMNYGFGLKTRRAGWLGFRADVRGFLGLSPTFGLARQSNDPNATVLPVSGPLHNAEASAGLIFYFFGKR